MDDLCYEYFKDGACLYNFNCLFVHKDVRFTKKTEIKNWFQYINKKLPLPGYIIISTWGFSN